MQIEEMQIEDLKPSEYNPRVTLEPGSVLYERIKYSIQTFGLLDPLVYNKQTQRLVGGHQRLNVLRDLGYKTVLVTVVDYDEVAEKMLNITLNKAQGEWDPEKLEAVLSHPHLQAQEDFKRIIGFSDAARAHELSFIGNESAVSWLDVGKAMPEVSVGAPETKMDHPDRLREETLYPIQFMVNKEQRDIFYNALNHCKETYDIELTGDAIATICGFFMDHVGDGRY